MLIKYFFAALLVSSFVGCQWLHQTFNWRSVPQAPIVFQDDLTSAQQVINVMKNNAARVQQLESSVSVTADGMPRLTGNLTVQVPRNLRLQAGLLGLTEMGVDVGSNDEVFWVWTKVAAGGQQPALFYARHEDYANSQIKKQMPLEPQWILDAIGLVHFEASDQFSTPFKRSDGNIEFSTTSQSTNGLVNRVFVVDAKYGWLRQQSVYINKRRVAWTNASEFKYFPEHQVSLPSHIQLHVDQPGNQTLNLAVTFSRFKINQFYGDPNRAWAMPQLTDVPMIDITKIQTGQNVQRDLGQYGQPGGHSNGSPDHRGSRLFPRRSRLPNYR